MSGYQVIRIDMDGARVDHLDQDEVVYLILEDMHNDFVSYRIEQFHEDFPE